MSARFGRNNTSAPPTANSPGTLGFAASAVGVNSVSSWMMTFSPSMILMSFMVATNVRSPWTATPRGS